MPSEDIFVLRLQSYARRSTLDARRSTFGVWMTWVPCAVGVLVLVQGLALWSNLIYIMLRVSGNFNLIIFVSWYLYYHRKLSRKSTVVLQLRRSTPKD
jgi:hypothetical protein